VKAEELPKRLGRINSDANAGVLEAFRSVQNRRAKNP
jgi:hypothetical protein